MIKYTDNSTTKEVLTQLTHKFGDGKTKCLSCSDVFKNSVEKNVWKPN